MNRRATAALGAAFISLAVASCRGDRARPRAPEIGGPAPDYATTSIAGERVRLADQRGKVVLLNIWATWCRPCRQEIPALQALYDRRRAEGLEVIGVSVDARGEEEKIRDFATQYGMSYPVWLDPDERVATTFLAIGVPATYLIARDGTLLWKHLGPVRTNDGVLEALIVDALRAGARGS